MNLNRDIVPCLTVLVWQKTLCPAGTALILSPYTLIHHIFNSSYCYHLSFTSKHTSTHLIRQKYNFSTYLQLCLSLFRLCYGLSVTLREFKIRYSILMPVNLQYDDQQVTVQADNVLCWFSCLVFLGLEYHVLLYIIVFCFHSCIETVIYPNSAHLFSIPP